MCGIADTALKERLVPRKRVFKCAGQQKPKAQAADLKTPKKGCPCRRHERMWTEEFYITVNMVASNKINDGLNFASESTKNNDLIRIGTGAKINIFTRARM